MKTTINLLIKKYNEYQHKYFFSTLSMYTDGLSQDEIMQDIEHGSIVNIHAPYFSMIEEPQPGGAIKSYLKGFEEKEIIDIIKSDSDFIHGLLDDIDLLLKVLKAIHT